MSEIESPLRKWRNDQAFSLEQVCDLFEQRGFTKPSTAKLSRIERDQNIPLEMLAEIEVVTGIPVRTLRPDLAKIFADDGVAQ